MFPVILLRLSEICVRIAVSASVRAGIIRAYVAGGNTVTAFSHAAVPELAEIHIVRSAQDFKCHAA